MGEYSAISSSLVGYQIRFDSSTVKEDTHIVFMTDGILLREVTADLLLRRYSAVIIDEAHERSVNTDILLGMLSRSIEVRKKQAQDERRVWDRLSPTERDQFEPPLQPLKLIIMSATLKVSDFLNHTLFPVKLPPVINVEARQYPVTVHFARRTEVRDYLSEALKKVVQIHRRLPPGGILVFLTGKREILHMCRKLKKRLTRRPRQAAQLTADDDVDFDLEQAEAAGEDSDDDSPGLDRDEYYDSDGEEDIAEAEEFGEYDLEDITSDNNLDNQVLPKTNVQSSVLSEEPLMLTEDEEADALRRRMLSSALGFDVSKVGVDEPPTDPAGAAVEPIEYLKPIILPLYAMLTQEQQNRIFQQVPPGYRLIVVATNVAETSITIPDIRYVVDSGREKQRVQEMPSGISKFQVCWISQMSAEQRKGRAGRTGAGHCYRLYSPAFFSQHMPLHQTPSILTAPLDDLLLQMKAIGIQDVLAFPFPTAPSLQAVAKAQDLLHNLGALEVVHKKDLQFSGMDIVDIVNKRKAGGAGTTNHADLQAEIDRYMSRQPSVTVITPIGTLMSQFPINPRFAKMLITLHYTLQGLGSSLDEVARHRLLQFTLSLVSVLAEKSPFVGRASGAERMTTDDLNSDDEDESEEDGQDSSIGESYLLN